MEYTVIYNVSLTELITEVNKYIADGWKPLGGVSVAITKTSIEGQNLVVFNNYQAMIKE